MKKNCYCFLALLIFSSSCAQVSGKKISSSDMSKFKKGSLGLSELKERYGEPLTSMDGTNEGSFYSSKCGKKGSPVNILQYAYSRVDHHVGSLSTGAQVTYFVVKNNKICFVSESTTAQKHGW
jgi:hypothetical protein